MICIFCREEKEKFKPEHVFPAALGGAFIINNVCNECNEKLGRGVDNDLNNHPIILLNRKRYKINRKGIQGERKIRNPFKGIKHKTEKGEEYFFEYNTEGKVESTLIPRHEELIKLEDGRYMGKMYMSAKHYISKEEAIKMYTKRIGADPKDIERVEFSTQEGGEIQIDMNVPNKPFMLGALKIAYEFTITFLPSYLEESQSRTFAQILLTNSVKPEEDKLFDCDDEIREHLIKKYQAINGLQQFHYVAILTSIKGKGLFCSVKLFDWYFSIQLSNKDDYLKTEELVIINNPLVHAFGMSMTMRLHQFQFTLNVRNLSRGHQRIIERSKDKEFKSRSGKIPVFDKAGKMLYSHIEGLAKLVPPSPHHYHHTNKQIIIPAEYSQETYYVKSFKENLLIPLQKVNFIYNLIY